MKGRLVKGQPKTHSLGEAVTNNAISFGLSFVINVIMYPKLPKDPQAAALVITTVFSLVSIVRTYFVRRLFNALYLRWVNRGTHPLE